MGSATILANNSSCVVTHGLSFTPTVDQIELTPQDNLGGRSFWVSNPTSTTFQINISSVDSGGNHVFSWQLVGAGAPTAPPGNFPIAASDVQAHLNATYNSGLNVYTVYGLQISGATVAAMTSYANNYLLDLLGGSITASDSRYSSAYMSAVDIACIRVLVISMGGSLVGAFDYFLGDLRVSRAGPYKDAIASTLQGFKDDLSRQMCNLSPVAVSFPITAQQDVPTYQGDLMNP